VPQLLIGCGYGALFAAAFGLAFRTPARRRVAKHWPALAGGLVWWLIGVAPLALIVVGWNDWRTTLPGLWLGLALIGFLGLVRPWLAAGFVLVRVAALLACPLAPTTVAFHLPRTTSTIAFSLVARQQRAVESTRLRLAESYPRLPRGAVIGYWSRFPMIEIAFYGQMAPRVWYGDSTLTWRWLWDPGKLAQRVDAAVSYNVDTADPAVVIAPAALDRARAAIGAYDGGHYALADQLAQAAVAAQPVNARELDIWSARTRARAAYELGDLPRADSLNALDHSLAGETPYSAGLGALIALRVGNRALAQEAAQRALSLEPGNAFARQVAAIVQAAGAGQ
jgi:hypothetical protein